MDVNQEIFVDNFAGGGGASTGIERALGRHVDEAINHAWDALGMHRINHPQTVHHCEDVFEVNPAAIAGRRRVGGAWFSPDCKHFSKAKGGKPLSKKIRGLAFVILRWAKIRTRVIYMENVEEIQTLGPLLPNGKPDPEHKGRTWEAFCAAMGLGLDPEHPDIPEMLEVLGDSVTREELVRGFGYHGESRELRACDYGTPTIRKRLFRIWRCDGMPIVWPAATHVKPGEGRGSGVGGKNLKPWRTVSECIDWSIPCNSIFLNKQEAKAARCRRPLKPATERRIACGIDRYVLKAKKPFLISLTHQGGEKAVVDATVAPMISDSVNNFGGGKNNSSNEPLRTQCAEVKGGHFELVSAHLARDFGCSVGQPVTEPAPTVMPEGQGKTVLVSGTLIQTGYGEREGQAPRVPGLDKPLGTVVAGAGKHALVGATVIGAGGPAYQGKPRPVDAPMHTLLPESHAALAAASLVKLRGDNIGQAADEPLATISAGGTHHATTVAYLAQHNGGFNTNPGHEATEPASTISAKCSQQQVVTGTLAMYYGSEAEGQALDETFRTVTAKPRFGLATCELQTAYPGMTTAQIEGALRVAEFLRKYGVQFDGPFATVAGYVIIDIGMRMLTARELFRAQGFPEDYVIDRAWVVDPKTGNIQEIKLSKEQQIRMCGNSVCPPLAEALVRENSPEMCIWRKSERRPLNNMGRRGSSALPVNGLKE